MLFPVLIAALAVGVASSSSNSFGDVSPSCLGPQAHRVKSLSAFAGPGDDGPLTLDGYPSSGYIPLLGNGYFSHAKGVRSDTYFVAGVFNNETTSPSHRARIPATMALTVQDSSTACSILDIEDGVYIRRGGVEGQYNYELKWFAHRENRNVYVSELTLTSMSAGIEHVTLEMNNNHGLPSEDIDFTAVGSSLSTRSDVDIRLGSTTIAETKNGPLTKVCVVTSKIPSKVSFHRGDVGKAHRYVTVVLTALDNSDFNDDNSLVNQALKIYDTAQSSGDALMASHAHAWGSLWRSGIEVSGRPDVASAANSSLFAILSSVRDDWPYGLAPGGLTNYYNGHSFWDTETWMYPSLLVLYPTLAKSLLQYRYDRLDGARLKAQSYDPPFQGAMFPWESAFSGVETCPLFADTGLREQHISADIALATWQYYLTSRDATWLRDVGYPIMKGVAQFWQSKVSFDAQSGVAHIRDVIPPDEYVDHVNDSVYTNYAAAEALRVTVKAAGVLGLGASEVDLDTWSKIADSLVILFDKSQGVHPEYEGYPGNVVKQADVVLLSYPLGMSMEDSVRRADLDYYSNRTDPGGPAMTWGMHAIGYRDLGDLPLASRYFNMSFQDNTHEPFKLWTETPDGNACNFITGAGGFLQTLVFGYPGLRITEEGFTLGPICPEGSDGVKLRGVHFAGNAMDLTYVCDNSSEGNPYPTSLEIRLTEKEGSRDVKLTGTSSEVTVKSPLNTLSKVGDVLSVTMDSAACLKGNRPASMTFTI